VKTFSADSKVQALYSFKGWRVPVRPRPWRFIALDDSPLMRRIKTAKDILTMIYMKNRATILPINLFVSAVSFDNRVGVIEGRLQPEFRREKLDLASSLVEIDRLAA